MNRPVIFDIDGVLADWCLGFTRLAHERGLISEKRIVPTVDNTSWSDLGGMPKILQSETWKMVKESQTFWSDLPVLCDPDTFSAIRHLTSDRDVYFVTNRMGLRAKDQTECWLYQHTGLLNPTVIISKRKGEIAKAVDAEFCIEDKAANASCVAWMTDDRCRSFLIDRPYNRCDAGFLASSVTRVKSVYDFLRMVAQC